MICYKKFFLNNKYAKHAKNMDVTKDSPQQLEDLARLNRLRDIEMRGRDGKLNPKDHGTRLRLLDSDIYKQKHGLKLVQRSLVPLDYPNNTAVTFD